jgi:anthranilate/para-aminobenzoate synthase component I
METFRREPGFPLLSFAVYDAPEAEFVPEKGELSEAPPLFLKPEIVGDEHRARIEKALESIDRGDCYQSTLRCG